MKIGVLALQGAFSEHEKVLEHTIKLIRELDTEIEEIENEIKLIMAERGQ